MHATLAQAPDLASTLRLNLNAQQAALDAAVPDSMRAVGAQSEFTPELRCAGKDGCAPALEALAQHRTQFPMYQPCAFTILQAYSVGGIGAYQARSQRWPGRQRRGAAELTDPEAYPVINAGAHRVLARAADGRRVAVLAAHHDFRVAAGARGRFGLRAHCLPQLRVVTAPAHEAEILARQSGGAVGGDQRRLYAEGP